VDGEPDGSVGEGLLGDGVAPLSRLGGGLLDGSRIHIRNVSISFHRIKLL